MIALKRKVEELTTKLPKGALWSEDFDSLTLGVGISMKDGDERSWFPKRVDAEELGTGDLKGIAEEFVRFANEVASAEEQEHLVVG